MVLPEYSDIPEEDQQAAQLVKVGEQYYKYGEEEANKWMKDFNLPYIIDTEHSNDLGMTVVNPDTGKAKIVFRGSDPGIDWGKYPNMTDWHFDYLLLTQKEHLNPQYWRTKWLFEKANKNYDLDSCIGYSKGSNHCYTWGEKYNVDTVTFNGAYNLGNLKATTSGSNKMFGLFGLGYDYIFGSGKVNDDRAKHKIYRVKDDPVSKGALAVTQKSHPNVEVITIKPQKQVSESSRTGVIGANHKIEHFYEFQLR